MTPPRFDILPFHLPFHPNWLRRSERLAATLLLGTGLLQPFSGHAFAGGFQNEVASGISLTLLPKIISPTLVSAQVGQAVHLQIGATGDPFSYGATDLPAGLSIDSADGLISGTPTQAGVFTANVTATNLIGTGSLPVTISVLPDNGLPPVVTAPVITGPANASGEVGQAVSVQVGATGNPAAYSATGLPGGLSINASTGLISGTPTEAGISVAAVTATNLLGSGTAPITITIVGSGSGTPVTVPEITSPIAASGEVGQALSYQVGATGDPMSYGATGLPAGLSINVATGLISGVPISAGVTTAVLTATNAQGSGSAPVTVTVAPNGSMAPTAPPMISSPAAASSEVGQAFSYQIAATGNPISYGAMGLPAGLSINDFTGLISGTPSQAGSFTADVTATNGLGTGSAALTLTIVAGGSGASQTPTVISPATASGRVGEFLSYQIAATGSPTSYAAAGLPAGLKIDTGTGLISGTPAEAGMFTAGVMADNAQGTGTASVTFSIAAAQSSAAPVITSSTSPDPGFVGVSYSYQITASGNPTSYDARGLPPGLSIDPNAGLVAGTPTRAGTFQATISATNAGGTSAVAVSFTISPIAPVITSPAAVEVPLGEPFSYQIEAAPLPTSFAATGLPPGLSIDMQTGLISGRATKAGRFPASVQAIDAGTTGTATIRFNVAATATSTPVIDSPAGDLAQVGQPFVYPITASNDPTSFGATGLPTGLTLDPSTGVISGIPKQPGSSEVDLTATGAGGTGLARLHLVILDSAASSAPVIKAAGIGEATVGEPYKSRIVASNGPTGYAAIGLPAGLKVNAVTGVISGTPTAEGRFSALVSASNPEGEALAIRRLVVGVNLPVVTLVANIPNVTVGVEPEGQFKLTRTGDTSKLLLVPYRVHGTAVAGTDYFVLHSTRQFMPGKADVYINVYPVGHDLVGADSKTVMITLDQYPTFKVHGSRKATVTLHAQ